jgi:hypothetical protein
VSKLWVEVFQHRGKMADCLLSMFRWSLNFPWSFQLKNNPAKFSKKNWNVEVPFISKMKDFPYLSFL